MEEGGGEGRGGGESEECEEEEVLVQRFKASITCSCIFIRYIIP